MKQYTITYIPTGQTAKTREMTIFDCDWNDKTFTGMLRFFEATTAKMGSYENRNSIVNINIKER